MAKSLDKKDYKNYLSSRKEAVTGWDQKKSISDAFVSDQPSQGSVFATPVYDNQISEEAGQMDKAREFIQGVYMPGSDPNDPIDLEDAKRLVQTVIWKNEKDKLNNPVIGMGISAKSLFHIINKDGRYTDYANDPDTIEEMISLFDPDDQTDTDDPEALVASIKDFEMRNFVQFGNNCMDQCLNAGVNFSDIQMGALPPYFDDDQGPKGDLIPG